MRIGFLVVCCLISVSCSDLDDLGYVEPEKYNIVELTFIAKEDNEEFFLSYTDPDLEGPLNPQTNTVQLKNNSDYTIRLNFAYDFILDEEERVDRNDTILSNSKDYQVFLILENENNSFVSTLDAIDTDDNQNTLGLEWEMNTAITGFVDMRVVLVYDPIKPNSNFNSAEGLIVFDATVNFIIQG
ncbi:MAG: hypothetical protein CMC19_01950 [Flavobacteriaceae bacterium]|nr:hypothetical protein [Flavobacteriaceae bacterium]OUX40429.1 MAG: hypothetical protein CBE25_00775 [Flavobacteriaceae bacterium TMED265]